MSDFSRRSFLAGLAAATASAAAGPLAAPRPAEARPSRSTRRWASLIDLSRCDGCPDRDTPACVSACRTANADRFPEPDPEKLKDYWPQPFHEDWSTRRHLTNRLTPYNWTFVQRVTVEHEGRAVEVNVPRRCMHCDDPPCVKTCPFGAMKQTPEGPTYVDGAACMGGAKCSAACPWDIPQRQAGVGFYTYLDPLPVGGGVMFKCDLCRDRLAAGGEAACAAECPAGAIRVGARDEIFAEAERLARQVGGEAWQSHLYGRAENGGTSTVYVSPVPVPKIDAAIVEQGERDRALLAASDPEAAKRLRPMRMHAAENLLDRYRGLAAGALAAPVLGAVAAFAATVARREKGKKARPLDTEAVPLPETNQTRVAKTQQEDGDA
jgi:formate dehydrogenase iron-sulfur subunit